MKDLALVRTDFSYERIASIIKVTIIFLRSVLRLLVTAKVPSSPILVTLMMEAILSSERSFLTRIRRRNIPADGILHSHCREDVKSYIKLNGWALYRRSNVSPVKYELDSYIPEDGIQQGRQFLLGA
jgi:hypothetical protein